jgi:uncharacterized membrane protein YfcA
MQALLFCLGIVSGGIGALVGIGGGVVLVPTLLFAFHTDIHTAVATSLLSVVATSAAAGSVYVASGTANLRLGMTLEVATTAGGVGGGLVATRVSGPILEVAFSVVLVTTAVLMFFGPTEGPADDRTPGVRSSHVGYETRGHLAGAYWDEQQGKLVPYRADRLWLGLMVSVLAGVGSGLLGVGGGFLKVPAMRIGMRVPMKVAAGTSNFMIGVTASSSLFVYLDRGYVRPALAAPAVLGITIGAIAGTSIARRASPVLVRWFLGVVLVGVAAEMLLKAKGIPL